MNNSPQLQELVEHQRQMQAMVAEFHETMLPGIEACTQLSIEMANILQPIADLKKTIDAFTQPIRKLQLEWFSTISALQSLFASDECEKAKIKINIVGVEGNVVRFALEEKTARKINSIHLLVLKALIFKSDENGFISHEDLEKFLVANGLKARKNERLSKERVWEARRNIIRFLGIPEKYNGREIIETVTGKGLKINNFLIEN